MLLVREWITTASKAARVTRSLGSPRRTLASALALLPPTTTVAAASASRTSSRGLDSALFASAGTEAAAGAAPLSSSVLRDLQLPDFRSGARRRSLPPLCRNVVLPPADGVCGAGAALRPRPTPAAVARGAQVLSSIATYSYI